jgi:hypothetical protein
MSAGKTIPTFLRQKEMQELITSEQDKITSYLMTFANNTLIGRILRNAPGPAADFDLCFFMEIVQEFASDQNTLKTILDGRADELVWFTDEEV